MKKTLEIAGVDLAWHGASNPSAVAVGSIVNNELIIKEIIPAIIGINQILDVLSGIDGLNGIAIDASLIINNKTGKRTCEAELSKMYSSKWASCHPTNQTLYPDAFSVQLSGLLQSSGFEHLGKKKWMIECYTHTSIIEVFGLSRRLLYKKGSVAEKKIGQKQLSAYILKLSEAVGLSLKISAQLRNFFDPNRIDTLKGQALKTNEDALDAIICLYTAGLYAIHAKGITFGDTNDGFIWVPQGKRI